MPFLPRHSFRMAQPRLLIDNLPHTIHTILSDHPYAARNIHLFQYRRLEQEKGAVIRHEHKEITLRGK